jgi:hypothetical protein
MNLKREAEKVKKSFFVMLLFFFSFCSVNIVSAAPDPFSDVPANHWAYDAVNKLAKAGIVNGYGDGTFRGGRIVSRFEMAMIVGNAMTKYDNADAENKVLIKKLATEFAGELQTLGKRVTTLEQNQSRLKIDGIFQYRQEYVHNPSVIDEDANRSASPATAGAAREKSESRTMVWLNVANQFDGDTYFKGSLVSETLGGRTVDTQLQVWDAYMAKKIGPQAELAVGRFFIDVGLGTLGGGPYYDGVNLKFYGENVKANLYNVRFGFQGINPITSSQYDNYTFTIGDMKYSLNKDLTLVLAYFADKDKNLMNAKAVGMEYKITPEFALSGEYAKNDSSIAKIGDNNQNPKAYFIRMKHGGANPFVPGSCGGSTLITDMISCGCFGISADLVTEAISSFIW